MTDTENNQPVASNAPTHIISVPHESGGKTYWTRIGAGWQHKHGGGINFRSIAHPIDGCFSIFPVSEKPE
jgi:hypothetical protein